MLGQVRIIGVCDLIVGWLRSIIAGSLPGVPSYEEPAALVARLTGLLEQANAQIGVLRAEVAALKSKSGKDSTNSSVPPSQDPVAAKAKRRAATSQRGRSKDRKRGGQAGREGSGLIPAVVPDRSGQVEPAGECGGCGAHLTHGMDAGASWAQIWDVGPIVLEKVHHVLPRRRCACFRKLTTPAPPFGQAGTVT